MCPFCRGTTKLVQIGGYPTLSTYQCVECEKITTVEERTGIDSYFEWLMSRTKSKRITAF